ncbi:alpha/beta fold hydrolase [Streptosporangiaceae bacterium NEAU-GS5]|nr:alpha/beta fold hydrolase [Streptosporangiaceae bacterium NEAU-GS5]
MTGELYSPAAGTPSRHGVLLIGGSEGGVSTRYVAALLASHGYPALAVGYFALPGLPATLHDIPIEYFAQAARLLPGPVRVVGYSRGTEAALLLSALYSDLVDETMVCAPADRVWGAFPTPGNAWTFHGKPQTRIPFAAIRARTLAVAGSDDRLWPSAAAADTIKRRTSGDAIVFPGAGHEVCGVPYLATSSALVHPVAGVLIELGGTPQANEAARRDSWRRLLSLLRR